MKGIPSLSLVEIAGGAKMPMRKKEPKPGEMSFGESHPIPAPAKNEPMKALQTYVPVKDWELLKDWIACLDNGGEPVTVTDIIRWGIQVTAQYRVIPGGCTQKRTMRED